MIRLIQKQLPETHKVQALMKIDENTMLQSVIEISVGLYSIYKAKTEKKKLNLHILILYNNIYNIKNTSKRLIHYDPFCV